MTRSIPWQNWSLAVALVLLVGGGFSGVGTPGASATYTPTERVSSDPLDDLSSLLKPNSNVRIDSQDSFGFADLPAQVLQTPCFSTLLQDLRGFLMANKQKGADSFFDVFFTINNNPEDAGVSNGFMLTHLFTKPVKPGGTGTEATLTIASSGLNGDPIVGTAAITVMKNGQTTALTIYQQSCDEGLAPWGYDTVYTSYGPFGCNWFYTPYIWWWKDYWYWGYDWYWWYDWYWQWWYLDYYDFWGICPDWSPAVNLVSGPFN